jgi:catechol 2,3-dioxygenase-like lactoylglutathione lyase family enzyme
MISGGLVTLRVADVERAVRFYVETLGMKLVEEGAGASIIDAGEGFRIELRQGAPRDSAITLYSKLSLDEAVAIYENRGVVFTVDREEGTAQFRDADNNLLTLSSLAGGR